VSAISILNSVLKAAGTRLEGFELVRDLGNSGRHFQLITRMRQKTTGKGYRMAAYTFSILRSPIMGRDMLAVGGASDEGGFVQYVAQVLRM
jgi:hypothetical protein